MKFWIATSFGTSRTFLKQSQKEPQTNNKIPTKSNIQQQSTQRNKHPKNQTKKPQELSVPECSPSDSPASFRTVSNPLAQSRTLRTITSISPLRERLKPHASAVLATTWISVHKPDSAWGIAGCTQQLLPDSPHLS